MVFCFYDQSEFGRLAELEETEINKRVSEITKEVWRN